MVGVVRSKLYLGASKIGWNATRVCLNRWLPAYWDMVNMAAYV